MPFIMPLYYIDFENLFALTEYVFTMNRVYGVVGDSVKSYGDSHPMGLNANNVCRRKYKYKHTHRIRVPTIKSCMYF